MPAGTPPALAGKLCAYGRCNSQRSIVSCLSDWWSHEENSLYCLLFCVLHQSARPTDCERPDRTAPSEHTQCCRIFTGEPTSYANGGARTAAGTAAQLPSALGTARSGGSAAHAAHRDSNARAAVRLHRSGYGKSASHGHVCTCRQGTSRNSSLR